jgi:hypothetical protein
MGWLRNEVGWVVYEIMRVGLWMDGNGMGMGWGIDTLMT